MRGRTFVFAFLLTITAAGTLSAQPPDRGKMVQALLERSRLLEDAAFRVPRSLYTRFVRETVEGPQRAPAPPVVCIRELGDYHLQLPAGPDAKLVATVRLRVLSALRSRDFRVLTDALSWKDVRVNGQPVSLPAVKGWLRFTPDAAGVYVITAETTLPVAKWKNRRIRLRVARTVRTLLRFDGDAAWEVVPENDPRRIRGDAAAGTHGLIGFTGRDELVFRFRPPEVVRERPARYELSGAVAWNLDAGRQLRRVPQPAVTSVVCYGLGGRQN